MVKKYTKQRALLCRMHQTKGNWVSAPFLDLDLSITNVIFSSKISDKRDSFNFEILKFPFLDGNVSRSPFYGICIYILPSLFVLREYVLMVMASTTETYI